MEMRIENNRVYVTLSLADANTSEKMVLEASAPLTPHCRFQILTDAQYSRQISAMLVGRLIVQWKLTLITSIDSALSELVTREGLLVAAQRDGLAGMGSDGTAQDGAAIDVADGGAPIP